MKKLLFSLTLTFCSLLVFAQEKPEGLFINSKAFDFKAKDQHGNEINMKELRKKGNVVVLFYRGNWCPYCNRQLKAFSDSLEMITAKGATLIAITPEAGEGIVKTIDKTSANFSIIHDDEMRISRQYGVMFQVDQKDSDRYKKFGNDLLVVNNQKIQPQLPVPAVYIVNKDGSVTYRFFEDNYKKRPTVKEILDNLK